MSHCYLFAFILVFLTVLVGIALLDVIAKDFRRPFPTEQKLLRETGHSLRKKLTETDRQITRQLLMPVLIGIGPMMTLVRKTDSHEHDALETALNQMTFGVLVCLMILALFFLISYARRRRNLTLGLFGERLVAEHLEPLKASGHRVFHDVPAGDSPTSGKMPPYNIDHVVVGPAGVFAIETKTRRQGRTRVGVMAHEIIYDGRALAFPWGEDRHGLEQAGRQAEWLAAFLERQLSRPVPVQPILVFPGWTVLRKDRGPVEVLSPGELPAFIGRPPASGQTGFAVPTPDPAILDLVIRELETRCRDVAF